MRPLRLLLSLSTCLTVLSLLLYLAFTDQNEDEQQLRRASASTPRARFNALFSFTSPGSLFPPSAIISLTDDNSTFFLARPAAFGPLLPSTGLSGALWIGSGFGDEALGQGELGCSDVPGWNHGRGDGDMLHLDASLSNKANAARQSPSNASPSRRERQNRGTIASPRAAEPMDGTDDHLHEPLPPSDRHRHQGPNPAAHADIQSLQEGAEIAGKVVLLKRGGCGFLEKVLWAQRRGGVALIVGDDVRGGGLVRMYARGDTSNVTIPALFTSHTTAHLLSSLLPAGGLFQDPASEDAAKLDLLKGGKGGKSRTAGKLGKKQTKGTLSTPVETDVNAARPGECSSGAQETTWLDTVLSAIGHPNTIRASSRDDSRSKSGHARPSSGEYTVNDAPKSSLWFSKLLGSNVGSSSELATDYKASSATSRTSSQSEHDNSSPAFPEPHEGLWVTLTPTNMSTSPFFDTLLVLVVSPLVTLTVVYALLLLRSRIRRRRWRAPKSLVERLPIRTYHTISDSSPSATPNASSPSTPLLQHSPPRPVSPRPPSRSDLEPEVPATSSSFLQPNRTPEEEKRETGLAAWRRRYGGRQRECVVCLEEYEDGVSQVMSLPCGHEFHADCITPWLVTRRRTCPICKGDVVRSLSQSYHDRTTSAIGGRFHDEIDEVQAQAAETRNDSPSASRPLPISSDSLAADIEANWADEDDDERGRDIPHRQGGDLSSSLRDVSSSVATTIWRGFEAVGRATGLQRRPSGETVDRDR